MTYAISEPYIASSVNYDNIEEMLDYKKDIYNELGYYPQNSTPSLQATYFALYILNAIGRLDRIDQDAVTNFIMEYR